jgi:hypothetical protein
LFRQESSQQDQGAHLFAGTIETLLRQLTQQDQAANERVHVANQLAALSSDCTSPLQ